MDRVLLLGIAAAQNAARAPLATPALWALQPEAARGGQLAAALVPPVSFGVPAGLNWNRLQLFR